MLHDIRKGILFTDLDTLYDEEGNKIDVYSSVYWSADSEEEYIKKETIIDEYKVDNELISLKAWCDISGYDYWVIQQEEENYVSIDVCLKKQPEEYSQEEIQKISLFITNADDYFQQLIN